MEGTTIHSRTRWVRTGMARNEGGNILQPPGQDFDPASTSCSSLITDFASFRSQSCQSFLISFCQISCAAFEMHLQRTTSKAIHRPTSPACMKRPSSMSARIVTLQFLHYAQAGDAARACTTTLRRSQNRSPRIETRGYGRGADARAIELTAWK